MKVLVTGGAGFIGSHVCEALLNKGDSVLCIDNFNDFYNPQIKKENIQNLNKNFILYEKDIRDYGELKKIFEENKIDGVVHLAAMAGVRQSAANPFLYTDVNIRGTLNMLELSRDFDVKNFIFSSSSSVYGVNKQLPFCETDRLDSIISFYGITKRAGEQLCKLYHDIHGLNVTCLRLFTVYGPRNRPDMAAYKFAKAIDSGKELTMYGDGTSKRDFTYISDVASAILMALEKSLKFEIINIGNSKTVELKYFISLFERYLGKKAKIKQLPPQPGDVPATYADISKARRLLGYEPKTNVEQGVKNLVEWYENEGFNSAPHI